VTVIDVKAPVLGVVLPIALGEAKVAPFKVDAFKLATLLEEVTVIDVKAPVDAVVLPIDPGLANVAPLSRFALRLATTVVLETVNGAVPVDTVDI
jgi:hypothetical protein